MDPIFIPALKRLAGAVVKRGIDREADQLLVFLGFMERSEALLEEINQKLDRIETTLERMERKIDDLMLKSLRAGYNKMKEAPRLPSRVKQLTIQSALNDFTDALAMRYPGGAGGYDAATIHCMAYFGKAAALRAVGAQKDEIAVTALNGFLKNAKLARMHMSDAVHAGLLQDLHANRGLVRLEVRVIGKETKECSITGQTKVYAVDGTPWPFEGAAPLSFLKYSDSNTVDGNVWHFSLPSNEFRFAFSADIRYDSSHPSMYVPPRHERWDRSVETMLRIDPGMVNIVEIVLERYKPRGNWITLDWRASMRCLESVPVDVAGERYAQFIKPHLSR